MIVLYGGLNENGSYGFIYLNAWCSVVGTVWEGFQGMALFEEMYRWVWALRSQKPMPFLFSSLPCVCG